MRNDLIPPPARINKVAAGLILTAVGVVLLLQQLGVLFPAWLTSWPMIPLIVGLTIGVMSGGRNPAWVFPFGVGVIFLLDRVFPNADFPRMIAPIAIIGIGLWIIFGRHYHRKRRARNADDTEVSYGQPENWRWKTFETTTHSSDTEYIEAVSVFSGVEKKIFSKNFVGGDVVTIMGGMELDLSRADIQGRVRLEITNIMGGTKLIVPSHWQIIAEMASVFGGIEDKRMIQPASPDKDKILVIDGTSIMGGLEIHSYT